MYGLAPDERITVGVSLHFRTVGTGHIQTHETFRHEELYNGGKDCLEYIFQTAAAEAVDGVVIRSNIAGKPHKADVIAAELLYTAAGIDITQIGIDKNLKHHAGVVRGTAYGEYLR